MVIAHLVNEVSDYDENTNMKQILNQLILNFKCIFLDGRLSIIKLIINQIFCAMKFKETIETKNVEFEVKY